MRTEVEKNIRAIRKKLKSTTNENEKTKLRNQLDKLKILHNEEKTTR